MNVVLRPVHLVLFLLLVGFVCDALAGESAQREQIVAQNDAEPTSDTAGVVAVGEDAYEQILKEEYKMFKFRDCPYSDEMGAHTFQCIQENDGFNAHGCYDDSVQLFCPESSN
jgi:hypothetical protein|tara:strand:+ start:411 stop:749 length:339 start_codon:yes stop_codon:yes gene_type:complete